VQLPIVTAVNRIFTGPAVEFMLQQGNALEGIIMHFASDPCAFVFLSSEETFGVFAVERNYAALIENKGGTERKQDDA
jgi:hypothetical protein